VSEQPGSGDDEPQLHARRSIGKPMSRLEIILPAILQLQLLMRADQHVAGFFERRTGSIFNHRHRGMASFFFINIILYSSFTAFEIPQFYTVFNKTNTIPREARVMRSGSRCTVVRWNVSRLVF
jgi:hypothetical protein